MQKNPWNRSSLKGSGSIIIWPIVYFFTPLGSEPYRAESNTAVVNVETIKVMSGMDARMGAEPSEPVGGTGSPCCSEKDGQVTLLVSAGQQTLSPRLVTLPSAAASFQPAHSEQETAS